jgi:hypothetical protein
VKVHFWRLSVECALGPAASSLSRTFVKYVIIFKAFGREAFRPPRFSLPLLSSRLACLDNDCAIVAPPTCFETMLALVSIDLACAWVSTKLSVSCDTRRPFGDLPIEGSVNQSVAVGDGEVSPADRLQSHRRKLLAQNTLNNRADPSCFCRKELTCRAIRVVSRERKCTSGVDSLQWYYW